MRGPAFELFLEKARPPYRLQRRVGTAQLSPCPDVSSKIWTPAGELMYNSSSSSRRRRRRTRFYHIERSVYRSQVGLHFVLDGISNGTSNLKLILTLR